MIIIYVLGRKKHSRGVFACEETHEDTNDIIPHAVSHSMRQYTITYGNR